MPSVPDKPLPIPKTTPAPSYTNYTGKIAPKGAADVVQGKKSPGNVVYPGPFRTIPGNSDTAANQNLVALLVERTRKKQAPSGDGPRMPAISAVKYRTDGGAPYDQEIKKPPEIPGRGTRQGAVNFVNEYATGYGTDSEYNWYFRRQTDDCTNFISNALFYGGGFQPDEGGHRSSLDNNHWAQHDIGLRGIVPSAAWATADNLINYLNMNWGNPSAPHGSVVKTVDASPKADVTDPLALSHAGMKPGDLIFVDWNNGHGIEHAAMYVGQQQVMNPHTGRMELSDVVSYHTNDMSHQYWALPKADDPNGRVTYHFVHIRYPNE
ncbi:amidase domain-containing protein [Gordonia sp. CPCC 205333]|uniref:amidase domain-containing protein n=1 Tax=Gordonia sp. CPCC 205333 TaxID=3140790 RepID=UPI003AF40107